MHITQAVLDNLNGVYEVEPGDGEKRSEDLKENNIVTYFIINPKKVCQVGPAHDSHVVHMMHT